MKRIFILLGLCLLLWSNEALSQERISLNRDWRYQENDPDGTGQTLHYSQLKPYLPRWNRANTALFATETLFAALRQ